MTLPVSSKNPFHASSRAQLDLLPTLRSLRPGVAWAIQHNNQAAQLLPVAKPPLVLRCPADGVCYDAREIAGMLRCRPATVRDWIARGLIVDGRRVRLMSMRAPHGRVAPGELCRFLARVNAQKVEVADESGKLVRDCHRCAAGSSGS